ncbi:TPA: DUF1345 domain-containing protein [Acinetobacter baumannii]|jgi:uncharacterized membrane protein|uniref:DUF1345 domain-containing protein n=26 Tax=Gammaproteobacteria TaxID=1236 RepID=A0ABX6CBK5_ACIB2|nr:MULTISPECIES: DUF1345 domain-containing protein [Gammaproteobacteria]ADX90882.1 hypothetical protein ABTW07_0445 [Acinetobacter baumannii TCDC-AB0715]AHX27098.1 hypothetical protein A478_00650 [Acinetobacter baumannii AC12]AHX64147.1 hypothetical protein B856_02455 [Acinetobacter baumannii AC30]EMT91464.1 hypothetical protein ABNIH5_07396 [Acinetobacter baumannii ABNIH5]EMT98406.1 hypothetical protein ABNIH6_00575 [Acinetobacter baumannii ABNIH6]EMT98911.1 hypothetical protein ABNIH10_1909
MVGLFQHLGRSVQNRPHFFIALIFGVVVASLLAWLTSWKWSTILLASWNGSISLYLLHVWKLMRSADHSQMQQQAKKQDESKWVIMLIVLLAITMSLVAILVQLSQLPSGHYEKLGHVALALLTIISAWLFMHTVFALHYAHDFYMALSRNEENGGLDFPGTEHPTYPDFLYFSYIIGTSAQTADVSITNKHMRLLNLFHAVLSFGFNTTILAICINVAAGFLTN